MDRCVDGLQLSNEVLDSHSRDCSLDAQSLERLVVFVVEAEKLVSINPSLSKESNSLLIDRSLLQEGAHLTNTPRLHDAHAFVYFFVRFSRRVPVVRVSACLFFMRCDQTLSRSS